MSGTEGPLSHIEGNHLFARMLRTGGARLARLVGPGRAVKHRRSALGFAQVFATTDHDFPFPPAMAAMFAMGPGRDRAQRRVVAEKCPRQDVGQTKTNPLA